MSGEESLAHAERLLEELEDARAKLEETDVPEAAIELLDRLSELARQIQGAIDEARRDVDAGT